MENSYTDKKFWDKYFDERQNGPTVVNNSVFADIFDEHLAADTRKTVLEIGCADSNFLCYLTKKFQYQAYGIDYSDAITKTVELFKLNNLPEPTLYKTDLFTWQSDRTYDLVCSFGLIEHFQGLDEIVKRHAKLVAPNGKLIITFPHFAHAQYFLHWLIDRDNLKRHNTKIMSLGPIKKAVQNSGLKIEYLSYYKTFGFWTENNNMVLWEKIINWGIIKFGKVVTKIFGHNRPNFLFSPHIVCVATKK